MAKKYLVSLDLNKNELLNARLQNLSSDPSSPVAGQIYYNTQDNVTKFYDGTQWVSGGSTKYGLFADRPAASKGGTLYVSTDTYTLFLDNGTSWIQVSVNASDLAAVVQSVSGIANQIDVVDTAGDITLSLPSTIEVSDLSIGNGNGSYIKLEDNSGDIIINANSGNAYINSSATDNRIITVADLAAVSSGLSWKQAANLLWNDPNAGITGATGTLAIDGHLNLTSANNGYRILITGGTNAGIWEFNDNGTTWTLSRSLDADTLEELKGAAVFVMEGTQYGSTSWVQSNHYLTDFTTQEWTQFSGQGTYIGSDSILIDGNQVSVILDSDTLGITSNGLRVNYYPLSGLENDGGLYVKLGTGLTFDSSGNITNDTSSGYGVRKYTQQIGDSSTTSIYVEHGLGTRSTTVQIFEAASPYAQVEADVEHTDNDGVTIKFAVAPSNNEYEVVVIG